MAQAQYAPSVMRKGFRFSTREITITGVLGAVVFMLGFYVPILAYPPLPTPVGNGTTLHIPVIIAAIFEGPVVGALVGAIFGFTSFIRATNPILKNPLIAFGPRILIGILAFAVFVAVRPRYARWVSALALGAGIFTVLGPGARQFESAFAAEKIASSWLINGYHAIARLTAPYTWVALVMGVLGAAFAFWVFTGEKSAPAAAAVAGTLTNTVGVLFLAVAFGYLPAGAAFVIGATHGLPEVILAVLLTVPIYRAVQRSRTSSAR